MVLIDKDKLVEALQEANCNECKEKECYSCMMWKIIDAPAVNALTYETVKDALSQIRWERDTALDQLAELGYELGEKIEADVRRVVQCKDCEWMLYESENWKEYPEQEWCDYYDCETNINGFCYRAERKEVKDAID